MRSREKLRWGLGALALLLPAPLFALACSSPSENVDAGDLLGVFSNDGGVEAGGDGGLKDAGVRRRRKKDGGLEVSPAADASVRPPVAGSCVGSSGEPDKDVKRVVGRPACRDAQVLEWADALGSPRYACVFAPKGVEALAPLPTVIFFHGGLDDPTMVVKKSSLHKLMPSADLSGDPAHKGFVIVAVQGRALAGGKFGTAFDTGFSGPENVDAAATDHFLAEIEKKGWVDKRRIYTLGASRGGQMAELYAMMRPDRVAAFGVFAAEPTPAKWACGGPPPPAAVIYRACDSLVSCDTIETWLHARDAEGADTAWLRLNAGLDDEPTCALRKKCSEVKGTANHRRWPKGKEEFFLKFFAKHALGPGAASPEADEASGAP